MSSIPDDPPAAAGPPRNILICCDGTGNEVSGDLSNVLKLFRMADKDEGQRVFYDPGVGTIGSDNAWEQLRTKAKGVFGLATGAGLDDNILDAYRFLVQTYVSGDRIYLFGFSRGAYTVRALAAFVHMVGLLAPDQINLCDYALTTYKRAGWRQESAQERAGRAHDGGAAATMEASAGHDSFQSVWDFGRVTRTRRVTIHFMGCWDTVASMIVPRPGLFSLPSLRTLPFTRKNPSVRAFRHAMAVDERRRMFRLNRWTEGQTFVIDPFTTPRTTAPQDCRQVWFAGVHSDVGGGYPESESALSKFPLIWMIEQAVAHGLRIDQTLFRHLAWGDPGGHHVYVPPDAGGMMHRSLKHIWWVLEVLPKSAAWREWRRLSLLGWYWPSGEPRQIGEGAVLDPSIAVRRQNPAAAYDPPNLPPRGARPPEGAAGHWLRKASGVPILAAVAAVAACPAIHHWRELWWVARLAFIGLALGLAVLAAIAAFGLLLARPRATPPPVG